MSNSKWSQEIVYKCVCKTIIKKMSEILEGEGAWDEFVEGGPR